MSACEEIARQIMASPTKNSLDHIELLEAKVRELEDSLLRTQCILNNTDDDCHKLEDIIARALKVLQRDNKFVEDDLDSVSEAIGILSGEE